MAAAVPPALWEAFHGAKDALLAALKTSVADAEEPSIAPRLRSETLDSIQASIDELSASLASMQKDVSGIAARTTKAIGRARYALSPLGLLPVEVLERVLDNAVVGPQDHRMIVRLTSVCDFWRQVVTSLSHLFSAANWDTWPTEFLEVWCSRAREAPLTVEMGSPGLLAIGVPSGDARAKFLMSTSSSWETLCIYSRSYPDRASEGESGAISKATELLLDIFSGVVPQAKLRHLGVYVRYARGFTPAHVRIYAPNLETIVWATHHYALMVFHPVCVRVCDIRPAYPTQLFEWFHMLHKSPLESLRIDYDRFEGSIEAPKGERNYVFASVKTLTLSLPEDNEFVKTFSNVSMPGVETVKLFLKQRDWSVIIKMLSQKTESVSRLQIEVHCPGRHILCMPHINAVIECLINDSTILPCLETLVIVDHELPTRRDDNGDSNAMLHREAVRQLISARKLRHVTTVGTSKAFIDELATEFDFFSVHA